MRRTLFFGLVAVALLGLLTSCGDDPSEAPRVDLPVVVSSAGTVPVTTDLGYEIEVTSARIVVEGIVFTVAGEAHASSFWRSVSDALIPTAYAHPGHYQGGEVTGELPGIFVLEWPGEDGRELGTAALIAGDYNGANFTFGRGSAELLEADDSLIGHTAIVSGSATKGGSVVFFTIVVDSPEGRVLVGAPLEASISEGSSGALKFQFNTADALEGDTLFDAIDFASLDGDGDGKVLIQPGDEGTVDAYNVFRRTFQTHDHYSVDYQE